MKIRCTGTGCNGYGCGSLLLAEEGDIKLYYKNRINYFLVCPVCNSVIFLEENRIPIVLRKVALESIRCKKV
jgi:hypothetical protein